MKHPDAWLIAVIFAVWAALAVMYATIPMIYMPHAIRVWSLGALLFLGLAGVGWFHSNGKCSSFRAGTRGEHEPWT